MKSALYITLALILGFAAAFGTFVLYNNHETKFDYDDLTYIELDLESNSFSGCFRSEKKSLLVSGIDYEIEDDNLYITVLGSASGKKALEIDKDNYAELTIEGLPKIKQVFYRDSSKDIPLTVN